MEKRKVEYKLGEYVEEKSYPSKWRQIKSAVQETTRNLQIRREAGLSVPRPIGVSRGVELYTVLHEKEVEEILESQRDWGYKKNR